MNYFLLVFLLVVVCCWCRVDGIKTKMNGIEVDCPESVTMVEETDSDAYVTQVAAYWNARRMHFTIDPPNSYFVIDQLSGVVQTSTARADRDDPALELKDGAVSLTVVVSPQSADGPVARCSMLVTIQDVNDNDPKFFRKRYGDVSVSPATEVGAIIETVLAEDRDAGSNSKISYRLQDADPDAEVKLTDYFQVDRISGQLKLVTPIDLSITPALFSFDGAVVAADGGTPPRISTAPLAVQVLKPPTYRQVETAEGYLTTIEASSYTGIKNDLTFTLLTPDDYLMDVRDNQRVVDVALKKGANSTDTGMRLAIRDGFGAQVIVAGSEFAINGQVEFLLSSTVGHFDANVSDNSASSAALVSAALVSACVVMSTRWQFY